MQPVPSFAGTANGSGEPGTHNHGPVTLYSWRLLWPCPGVTPHMPSFGNAALTPLTQPLRLGSGASLIACAYNASAHGTLERVCEIGLFPGKTAIFFGCTAEMSIGRRSPIDRPGELERTPDAGRSQREDLGQYSLDLPLVDPTGAVHVHEKRHWV